LNSGPPTCWKGTLPLQPHPYPFSFSYFSDSISYFCPGPTSDSNPHTCASQMAEITGASFCAIGR
jgi:hypothetical protein